MNHTVMFAFDMNTERFASNMNDILREMEPKG